LSADTLMPTGPFLDPPPECAEFETARVCLLPVPYDATASYQPGTRFGPAALIAASHQVELFDEELEQETYRIGIHTCPPVPPNMNGPQAMVKDVRTACLDLHERGKFIALVGGEHTVTLGALQALREVSGDRPFGLVQFDAHRDLRLEYESSAWSHACVAARAVEWGIPLVQAGVRAWSREELAVKGPASLIALTARQLQGPNAVVLFEKAIESLPDEVYLTFDLDALDPSIMPATGTPEPGGLFWYPVLDMLQALAARRRLLGLDMVELSPIAGLTAPNLLAARLLYRLIGLAFRGAADKSA
jgi:agmatinase